MGCLVTAKRIAKAWQAVEDGQNNQNVVRAFLHPVRTMDKKINCCAV